MNLKIVLAWTCCAMVFFEMPGSAANLTHRYPFSVDASDAVGGSNGQLVGGAAISGGAVVLNGSSAYVNLPNNLVTGYTAITIEAWVTDNGSGNWARIYDFGNSSGGEDFPIGSSTSGIQSMFLTPRSSSGTLLGNYTTPSSSQSVEWSGTPLPTGVQQHVVWASDAAAQTAWLYVNGVLVGSNTDMSLTPAAIGNTTNDWIGRSQWNDPLFKGSISDFRIYNGALSHGPRRASIHQFSGCDHDGSRHHANAGRHRQFCQCHQCESIARGGHRLQFQRPQCGHGQPGGAHHRGGRRRGDGDGQLRGH